MKIIHDRTFYMHVLVQGVCAIIFVFCVLFFLDFVKANRLIWAAGASSLASSAFVVFGIPRSDTAWPHRILFGYLIAMVCGHLVRLSVEYLCAYSFSCSNPELLIREYEIAAVVALGLTFFIMVMLRSSHPPAAGLAVVMVIDIANLWAMVVIALGALCLALVMLFGRKHLLSLI